MAVRLPVRKSTEALRRLGSRLLKLPVNRLRGHLSDGIDVPKQADSMAQYKRRP